MGSPAVSDYSISRPSSPTYNPSVSDYRLPHLAAYPICWSGTLGLKNDMANVRMHYVSGNRDLAKASLPDTGSTLKIVQRMRLEDSQLDGVARKMETKSEHCMLLALPNGSEHEEIEHQSKILRSNFITYLQNLLLVSSMCRTKTTNRHTSSMFFLAATLQMRILPGLPPTSYIALRTLNTW